MEDRLKLRLVGLGGIIATLDADRTWGAAEVQEAMVSQCQLPGWQYKLIDGVDELHNLASLTVIDEDPEAHMPVAEITAIRQANPDCDHKMLQDAIADGVTLVLQVALKSGFNVDDAITKNGASLRKGRNVIRDRLWEGAVDLVAGF